MRRICFLFVLSLAALACGNPSTTAQVEPVGSTQAYECAEDADCAIPVGAECVLSRCADGACGYVNAATQVEFLTVSEFAATEACRVSPAQACSVVCDDGEYCTDDLCVGDSCVNVPRAEPVHCQLAEHPQSSAVCAWKRCLVLACGAGDDGAPCLVASAPDTSGVCEGGTCAAK